MKRSLLFAAILLTHACGDASDPLDVTLDVMPNPPQPGTLNFEIRVTDQGAPVSGVAIEGEVQMESGLIRELDVVEDGERYVASAFVLEEGAGQVVLSGSGPVVFDRTFDLELTCPPAGCGLPVLGAGAHTPESVVQTVLADGSVGLNRPRDVAFNPSIRGELWIINRATPGTESMTVLSGVGTGSTSAETYSGGGVQHFMAQPSSFAFGAPGTLATIHETDDLTQGPMGTPPDFMGPTLHDSTLPGFNGGHASHLDMLHNSPNGMGIAWEGAGNVYWVFDGYHSSLTRYDFRTDHGRGGADHSDAEVQRFVEGQVAWVENVPSHMEVDPALRILYVADTGNNRIATLDIESGTPAGSIPGYFYDGLAASQMSMMAGTGLDTLVDGTEVGMVQPSGLAIAGSTLFVGDHASGIIYGFDRMTGVLLDYLDTGLGAGALGGITSDDDGNLYYTSLTDELVQISAL